MEKIKANLNYVLCTFLGAFHFVMLAFTYYTAFYKYSGESDSEKFCNGYKVMSFGLFDDSKAQWLSVIIGILQILLLVAAVGLLVYGILGLLKAFGIFDKLPNKIGAFDSKKLASLALMGYAAITLLMFILMIIYGICNTQSMYGYKVGLRVGFGGYFALIFAGLIAAAPLVLPKYVSGLNEETSAGPQVTYVCTNCGKKAPKGVRFCNACGGNVAASVVKQYTYVCTGCGTTL